MSGREEIKGFIRELEELSGKMRKDEGFLTEIEKSVLLTVKALKNNKKILVFGNGGSAAEAQHFAAEFVNKYKINRSPWPAISLVTDTSNLSSIANDFGYDHVFSKQIEALGQEGDIVFALTTSDIEAKKGGHSANIYQGLLAARKKGLATIGLVSEKSQEILKLLDVAIKVPSKNTPRIQEAHLMVLHSICEIVEKKLFQNEKTH